MALKGVDCLLAWARMLEETPVGIVLAELIRYHVTRRGWEWELAGLDWFGDAHPNGIEDILTRESALRAIGLHA